MGATGEIQLKDAIETLSNEFHLTPEERDHLLLREGNIPWLATAVPKLESPDWGDERQPYPLTWEEQDQLVSRLPIHLVPPTLFSLATGAREQEVAPLKWDQECQVTGLPAGAVWWVPPEIRKGSAKKTRSEQQGRYLIANTMARSVINKLRGNGSDFLFPGPKGNRVERMNNTGFRNARKAANLAVILRAVTGCDTKRDTNKNSGLVTAVSA